MPLDIFYQPYLSHFYTNVEVAREHQVSLQSLQAEGRLTGYGMEFYPNSVIYTDLYTTVTSFSSAAGARTDLATRIASLRSGLTGQKNFSPSTACWRSVKRLPGRFRFACRHQHAGPHRGRARRVRVFRTLRLHRRNHPARRDDRGHAPLAQIMDHRIQAG